MCRAPAFGVMVGGPAGHQAVPLADAALAGRERCRRADPSAKWATRVAFDTGADWIARRACLGLQPAQGGDCAACLTCAEDISSGAGPAHSAAGGGGALSASAAAERSASRFGPRFRAASDALSIDAMALLPRRVQTFWYAQAPGCTPLAPAPTRFVARKHAARPDTTAHDGRPGADGASHGHGRSSTAPRGFGGHAGGGADAAREPDVPGVHGLGHTHGDGRRGQPAARNVATLLEAVRLRALCQKRPGKAIPTSPRKTTPRPAAVAAQRSQAHPAASLPSVFHAGKQKDLFKKSGNVVRGGVFLDFVTVGGG